LGARTPAKEPVDVWSTVRTIWDLDESLVVDADEFGPRERHTVFNGSGGSVVIIDFLVNIDTLSPVEFSVVIPVAAIVVLVTWTWGWWAKNRSM